jgi:hypothetical protein
MTLAPCRRQKRIILSALAIVLAGRAGAQLVGYEGFEDYAVGTQVESGSNGSAGTPLDGGTGWGGAYDVSNAIKSLVRIENRGSSPVNYTNGDIVLPGGVRALRFYDIANGSYAVRRPLGTVFHAAAGDTLWFSVLFRTAAGGASPLANQDFFQIGFDDNEEAVAGNPRVSIGSNTVSTTAFPAGYHFFARSSTAVASSAFHEGLPIAAATTYLLVGQVRPAAGAYDTVSLFVNPSSLDDPGPPSATFTAPSGLASLSHAFIRTAGLDNGDAYVLDEWRVGRDYGSVVGSPRNALEIIPASVPGGTPVLRWPGSLPGVVLESSTTLAPDSWEVVPATFTLAAGDWQFPVPMAPEVPRRFYRLRR